MSKPKATAQHQKVDNLLEPLIDFCNAHEFHYMIIIGKDQVCSRYSRGNQDDINAMITGMIENNPKLADMIATAISNLQKQ